MLNVLVFLIIVLPLVFPQKHKDKAILLSFLLLFIPFGLQYEMTRDWPVYVNRWLQATKGYAGQERELEFVYSLIMQLCEPLTYFGYLMVCAVFNLWIFHKYLKRYVPMEWAWLTFAIFLLRMNFAMTYIDTNRQTLAITFTMLGLYMIINPPKQKKNINALYGISGLLFLAAINIHTSAVIALPILFFPLLCRYLNSRYLWLFIPIYIGSFIMDFNAISNVVGSYMATDESLSSFSQYAEEISVRDKSLVEQGIYGVLLFLLVHLFDRFKSNEKPLLLAVIVFISFQGYAMYTMLRALFFYQVYSIYIIPLLFAMLISSKKSKLACVFLVLFIAYSVFSFQRDIKNSNMDNWKDFKTVFQAPVWM